MKYSVISHKSVDEVVESIKFNARSKDFGISSVIDVHHSLSQRGVFFTNECKVIELSNPNKVMDLLSTKADMSMILPCKISVVEEDGQTVITMFKETQMYRKFTHRLDDIANQTEEQMRDIVKLSA